MPALRLTVRPLRAACCSMCPVGALAEAWGQSAGAAADGGQAAGAGPRIRMCHTV